jgi:hypothetical protein
MESPPTPESKNRTGASGDRDMALFCLVLRFCQRIIVRSGVAG